MFVANVNFETVYITGKSAKHEDIWENETLDGLQRDFWNVFHAYNGIYFTHSLLSGTITDTNTGNTWGVNSWGRKLRAV